MSLQKHIYTDVSGNLRVMKNTAFSRLPHELLLQSLSYLAYSDTERFLSTKQFREGSTDLCNVTLACKRLLPVAQEILFHTPLLRDSPPRDTHDSISNIVSFTHALVVNPSLRKYVKQLRIELPKDDNLETRTPNAQRVRRVLQAHVDKVKAPASVKQVLKDGLRSGSRWSLVGVLMTLTPALQRLSVLPCDIGTAFSTLPVDADVLQAMFNTCSHNRAAVLHSNLQYLPGFQNLSYFKFKLDRVDRLQNLRLLSNITTLDIEPARLGLGENGYTDQLKRFLDRQEDLPKNDRVNLDHVSHLRWDCRYSRISRHILVTLSSFCVLSLFTSLRILDIYGDATGDDPLRFSSRNGHNVRIIHSIEHLHASLETLRLPETIAMHMQLGPPIFADLRPFVNLTKLLVPQSFLIARLLDDTSVNGPLDFLPPALESLTVFSADQYIFDWTNEMFMVEDQHLALKKVQLSFASASRYFGKEWVTQESFWSSIAASRIQWSVTRDTLIPALDILA